MLASTILVALLSPIAILAAAPNIPLPPTGKVYIGTWLDTADPNAPTVLGDRPTQFNDRMGFKASAFQYAQNIPVDTFPAPLEQIKATATDAFMFLTIYARPSPWSITDADIAALVAQCKRINNDEHTRLLIRFSPEMNGDWNYYGGAPVKYKALWIRVYTAVKSQCPSTDFVWAPSEGTGYPFSIATPTDPAELAALDTNNNGRVDAGDDPYSPYYPGDEYVDWVGLSIYHYGDVYPWVNNVEATPGKFDSFLNAAGFYQSYSAAKNKPFAIAEGAAAFHTNVTAGVGELAVKQTFWRQWLTNSTLLNLYPNIKLFNLFEYRKDEEITNRDFRVSVSSTVRTAFLSDFEAVRSQYVFANTTGNVDYTNTIDVGNNGSNNSGSLSTIMTMQNALLWTCLFLSIHFLL